MSKYDLVVIGGGHNGLTTAAIAAKAGRKVLVLEKRKSLGGLCAGDEFHPGYKSTGILQDSTTIRDWAVDQLNLESHGLRLRKDPVPVFLPSKEGKGILLWKDAKKMTEELAPYSTKDADSYKKYRSFLSRVAPFIKRVFDDFPPDVTTMSFPGIWNLGKKAVTLRMLGKQDMMEVLRIAPMCSADFINEYFETEQLRGLLAGPSVFSTYQGPWSPGSNANLLLAESLGGAPIEGGPVQLVNALEKACKAAGVEIRTSASVDEVVIKDGKATGVKVDGEEIAATKIAASCDPKTLFLDLMPSNQLTFKFENNIVNWRSRGTVAKINLGLNAYPEFACRPGLKVEYARTGESLDEIEKAFDSIKYREFSKRPTLEIYIPTLEDSSLAPEGHHVMSILVNFAYYDLKGGWSEEKKKELFDNSMAVLADYVPNIKDLIVGSQILSPKDIETEYGTKGGHLHHGEHAADQLLVRPSPETAQYTTPYEGLYMCGAGSHPGGGVSCAPGVLASKAILHG